MGTPQKEQGIMDANQRRRLARVFKSLDASIQGSQIAVVVPACGREVDWLRRTVVALFTPSDRGLAESLAGTRFKCVIFAGIGDQMYMDLSGCVSPGVPTVSCSLEDLESEMRPLLEEFMARWAQTPHVTVTVVGRQKPAPKKWTKMSSEDLESFIADQFPELTGLSEAGAVDRIRARLTALGFRVELESIRKIVRWLKYLEMREKAGCREPMEQILRLLDVLASRQIAQELAARAVAVSAQKSRPSCRSKKVPPQPVPVAEPEAVSAGANGNGNGHSVVAEPAFEYPGELLEHLAVSGQFISEEDHDVALFRREAAKNAFFHTWIKMPIAAIRIRQHIEWARKSSAATFVSTQ